MRKKEEEIQPLVDEVQIIQNKDENEMNQLIPPCNQDKKQGCDSPTPPSDEYEEDKQLLQDAIEDVEQLNSDDYNSEQQPEYSKDNNENEEDIEKQLTPISKIDEKIDEKQPEEELVMDEKYDKKYALPKILGGIPIESMEKMDDEDNKTAQILRDKYINKLNKYSCVENMNFIHRYTIGYKHIKKKKRMNMIYNDIDYFFEMYEKYDIDNIINS
eukprot:198346_1